MPISCANCSTNRGIDYLFANAGTDFAPIIEAYAKGQGRRMAMKVPAGHGAA